MKYNSFQEYLLANNLTDQLSEEERKALQNQWRKAYQKSYHKQYGKKRIRKTITLTLNEDAQLKKAIKKYDLEMNAFLKQCIFSYLNQAYIVPEKETVEELIMQIRKIGTNVNQVARHVNGKRYAEQEQLDVLYGFLARIEAKIEEHLFNPLLLDDALKKALEERPEYRKKVAKLLRKYETKKRDA